MTFEKIIANIDTLPPLSNAANAVRSMYASGLEIGRAHRRMIICIRLKMAEETK